MMANILAFFVAFYSILLHSFRLRSGLGGMVGIKSGKPHQPPPLGTRTCYSPLHLEKQSRFYADMEQVKACKGMLRLQATIYLFLVRSSLCGSNHAAEVCLVVRRMSFSFHVGLCIPSRNHSIQKLVVFRLSKKETQDIISREKYFLVVTWTNPLYKVLRYVIFDVTVRHVTILILGPMQITRCIQAAIPSGTVDSSPLSTSTKSWLLETCSMEFDAG